MLLQMGFAKEQVDGESGDGAVQWISFDGKKTSFADMDPNGDGVVDLPEFRKWYLAQEIGDPMQDEAAYQDRHHVSTATRLEHIEHQMEQMSDTLAKVATKILGNDPV